MWIIQDNLFSEAGHEALLDALDRGMVPYTLCKFLPFTHKLVAHDTDFSLYNNVDEIPEIVVPEGHNMVCGSTLMSLVAKEKGWTPGTFLNDNFHYSKWKEHWGAYLLNDIAIVGELGTIDPWVGDVFIRPCKDTKAFTGTLVPWFVPGISTSGEMIS